MTHYSYPNPLHQVKHKARFLPFLPTERKNFFTQLDAEKEEIKAEKLRRQQAEKQAQRLSLLREKEAQLLAQIEEERIRGIKAAAKQYEDQVLDQPATPLFFQQPVAPPPPPASLMMMARGGRGQVTADDYDDEFDDSSSSARGGGGRGSNPWGMTLNLDLLPLDGPELEHLMLTMGFIKAADRGKVLSISGKVLPDPLPPLQGQRDEHGNLIMQDRYLMGVVLDEGEFAGHQIIWPGRPLQLDELPKDTERDLLALHIKEHHLYWLRNLNAPAVEGRRPKNVVALRLRDGRFVPHRYSMIRITQRYAEAKKIPLNNQVRVASVVVMIMVTIHPHHHHHHHQNHLQQPQQQSESAIWIF
jgi:hypothetical protein